MIKLASDNNFVGTGVVVGAGYGGYKLNKARKKRSKRRFKKEKSAWEKEIYRKYPEMQINHVNNIL